MLHHLADATIQVAKVSYNCHPQADGQNTLCMLDTFAFSGVC